MHARAWFNVASAAGAVALTAFVACPAQASQIVKFAEFQQVPGGPPDPNLFWKNGNLTQTSPDGTFFTGSMGLPGAVPIQFSFLTPALSSVSNVSATLLIYDAGVTGVPATPAGPEWTQTGLVGKFKILYQGASDIVIGLTHYHTGATLLSGTFSDGVINIFGSTGATLVATSGGSLLSFKSDFMSFANTLERDLSLGMVSIGPQPAGAKPGASLKSFKSNAIGEFSLFAVPEPSTWAMMVVGAGLIGWSARRRRAMAAG
jgi:hypothetical protein